MTYSSFSLSLSLSLSRLRNIVLTPSSNSQRPRQSWDLVGTRRERLADSAMHMISIVINAKVKVGTYDHVINRVQFVYLVTVPIYQSACLDRDVPIEYMQLYMYNHTALW